MAGLLGWRFGVLRLGVLRGLGGRSGFGWAGFALIFWAVAVLVSDRPVAFQPGLPLVVLARARDRHCLWRSDDGVLRVVG